MPVQTFETHPYYDVADDAVMDLRLREVDESRRDSLRKYGTHAVNEHAKLEYVGSDGEDLSGFIAMHEIRTPEDRQLAIIRSWRFAHSTGLPPNHHSWSAEFDDVEVAKDFWEDWQPNFDGMKFSEEAGQYLDEHSDVPRRTVRIQELGLLRPWYDQKGGDAVLLDAFSTAGQDLVDVPAQHPVAKGFTVGQVYKVPKDWGPRPSYVTKTCLAAFVIPGDRHSSWSSMPDMTVLHWSDGTMSRYSERELSDGDIRLRPLTESDL